MARKRDKNISGTKLDYIGVKAAAAVDFRGDNMTNFESLEKIQLIYMPLQRVYIYKIEIRKLKIPQDQMMMTGEV